MVSWWLFSIFFNKFISTPINIERYKFGSPYCVCYCIDSIGSSRENHVNNLHSSGFFSLWSHPNPPQISIKLQDYKAGWTKKWIIKRKYLRNLHDQAQHACRAKDERMGLCHLSMPICLRFLGGYSYSFADTGIIYAFSGKVDNVRGHI